MDTGRGKYHMIYITCRDMGVECDFTAEGPDEYEALAMFMRHVQEDHTTDWFELEEINIRAQAILRHRAA